MNVSPAESIVMEALWQESPLSADDIIAVIAVNQNWGAATVKTLLNRLLKKEALTATREGRKFLYTPVLSRNDYIKEESQGMVDRLFEGRLSSLLMHFSQNEKLSATDITELKQILEKIEDD